MRDRLRLGLGEQHMILMVGYFDSGLSTFMRRIRRHLEDIGFGYGHKNPSR